MKISILDTVVLEKDLPINGLKKGDIGAVVETYEPDGLEVEFVTGTGETQAIVTLNIEDIRTISGKDILAVRSLDAA